MFYLGTQGEKMTIRHMKIFIMVYECNSITLAAKKLFVAQPAVSFAIKELEEYYGVKFFDRISKKLYITEKGKEFFNYSSQIINLVEEMENRIKNSDKLGILKIGSSLTIGKYFLNNYIKKFQQIYPLIQTNICIENSNKIEEKILDNLLDIGLIEGIVHSDSIISETFFEDKLVFICNKLHPYAKKQKLLFKDILKENFILREKGSGVRELFNSFLTSRELVIKPGWESISTGAIINAVKNNMGISLLSYQMVKKEIESGEIAVLNIKDTELKRKFNIIYHKNKFITPSIKKFINICKDV